MTVSRVVNNTGRISEETRRHVREIIGKLDYRPSRAARALVTRQTLMIAVVVPDITNPYFAEIVQGAEDAAWQHGYSVLLANTNENPEREEAVLRQLEESTVDGVIVVSSRLPDAVLLSLIEKWRGAVLMNRRVSKPVASVVHSRIEIGYRSVLAGKHLIETGRKRIGYLRLKRSGLEAPIEEFIAALSDEGVEIHPDWCATCLPTWEAGYQAAKKLLAEHPELDAVVGGNDLVALGAMRAAIELGRRIPDDLAITGSDNILLSREVTPALTTFSVPKYELGAVAIRLLLQRLGGDTECREYLFDEELIVRGTTV
jgi:LacI family transcriptional regulator